MQDLPFLLRNTFLINTERTYEKCLDLSQYHYDAILAHIIDPFFAGLLAFYGPLHVDFVTKYKAWKSAGSVQQGDTLNVKQMLENLSKPLIRNWDVAIQVIYPKDTPAYEALLPNGRKPFQTGKQEERIIAVATLISNIGSDAALATVKTAVQTWLTAAQTAQATKEGKKSVTKTSSTAVEQARVAVCQAMWKNLMDCGGHFYENPDLSAPYFNWEALRSGDQSSFSLTVEPKQSKLLAKRTLAANEQLKVTNSTDTAAEIGCTNKGGGITQKTTSQPHSVQYLTPAAIGNSKATPLIMVTNAQEVGNAHLMIEIVKV